MEFRIVKRFYGNDSWDYVVQRKMRMWRIGPKVWQYYWVDNFDGIGERWSIFQEVADRFRTEQEARDVMEDLKWRYGKDEVVKQEVIK